MPEEVLDGFIIHVISCLIKSLPVSTTWYPKWPEPPEGSARCRPARRKPSWIFMDFLHSKGTFTLSGINLEAANQKLDAMASLTNRLECVVCLRSIYV